MRPDRSDLIRQYDFPLDGFQLRAFDALDEGRSVLVAAPTGSGKTVVAEYAIEAARLAGRRAFYTAPIKALSNQKYHDLVARYGADEVGLLTGDNSINGDAPVVVMTTEVLRNMIYARSSALDLLDVVVLDEVHFLQDAYRGPVWEEVIIHLPASVHLVCLSATVSNAAGAHRLDQHRPRPDHGDRRGAPTRPAGEPLLRRRQDPRPHPPAAGARRTVGRTTTAMPTRREAMRAPRGGRNRKATRAGASCTRRRGSTWSSMLERQRMLPGDLLHLQPQPVRRGRPVGARRRGSG